MVDRRRDASLAAFLVEGTPSPGATVALGETAAHHARVRRLAPGDAVALTDGAGTIAHATLTRIGPRDGEAAVESCAHVERPAALTLLVPVADRDRMLWLAEKAAEFGVTTWRPVVYARSRSVAPRGEGPAFARRLRARMVAAVEQSGGAWLPVVHEACSPGAAIAACGEDHRFVLDRSGAPLPGFAPFDATAVALGPEGGFAPEELDLLLSHGWRTASLGGTTLRFETAGVAAVAIVRAAQVP